MNSSNSGDSNSGDEDIGKASGDRANVILNEALMESYYMRNYNKNNKWITQSYLNLLFKDYGLFTDGTSVGTSIGYLEIKNIELYKNAFVHESYLKPTAEMLAQELPLSRDEIDINYKKYIPFQEYSYDRLEFMGDRILDAVICDYIYHRYPKENDGFLSDLKTKMVRTSTLSIFSKQLKFNEYLILSKRYEKCRSDDDVLEDVFEAFLGAIYEDFGCGGVAYDICKKFIFKLIEKYLNMTQIVRREDNYKKQLMEFYHQKYKTEPKYTKISVYGPTYNRIFKAGVLNIDNNIITTGEGTRLIDAEQIAAREALKYYGVEVYDEKEEMDKDYYD